MGAKARSLVASCILDTGFALLPPSHLFLLLRRMKRGGCRMIEKRRARPNRSIRYDCT